MKQTLRALIGAAIALASACAHAQAYPARPIKWIIPFPPSGAMDSIARTLAEHMGRSLGQPFVIENRPGAGGNIGSDAVATAPADGYTMMIVANGIAVNKFLYARLPYDPVKSFAPVSLVAVVPNVLVANADRSQAKTVADVIAKARAHPGKYTYASAGNGTSIHLAGVLFTSMAKVDMVHIPYKGSGPAVTDLLGGQVDYMFDSVSSSMPHIRSGRLRPIAVTTTRRSSALPDVPTVAESGLPGYELSPWYGVFMPAGTPAPIVAKINAALVEAMKRPEVKARFAALGAEAVGSSPQELARHLDSEMATWGRLIQERGIRAD